MLEGEAQQPVEAKRRNKNSLWGQKSFLEDSNKGKTQMGIFLFVANMHMVCFYAESCSRPFLCVTSLNPCDGNMRRPLSLSPFYTLRN